MRLRRGLLVEQRPLARDALEKGGEAAESAVAEASSVLDRAAKRGAIHKNAARRGRSRLAKREAKKH